MVKRKRHVSVEEETEGYKNLRKRADAESESSTDDESLAEVRDCVRAYKGNSDDEVVSDDSQTDPAAEFSASEELDRDSEEDEAFGANEKETSDVGLALDSEESGLDNDIADERSGISFGALAKAQSQLTQPERTDHDRQENKVDPKNDFEAEALERKAGKKDDRDFNRQSKHAPTEVSSKKAVSRKRSVVPIHKINIRDPRFDLTAGQVNDNQIKKNYAFLSDYRDSEIAELKAGIRKTKDPRAKATMERALKSMESRRKTEQLNEQKQDIIREYRKEEAQKVKEGKKPFFLKSSEVRKRALEERFKAMKSRERTKAVERRRKKNTAKERKDMPEFRRG